MPYDPFTVAGYAASTVPPVAFGTTAFVPSTVPPTPFGSTELPLADIAALKAIATTALEPDAEGAAPIVRQVVSTAVGEVVQVWQLQAGTHADDVAGGYAQPTDYDAEDNKKYWVRIL